MAVSREHKNEQALTMTNSLEDPYLSMNENLSIEGILPILDI